MLRRASKSGHPKRGQFDNPASVLVVNEDDMGRALTSALA